MPKEPPKKEFLDRESRINRLRDILVFLPLAATVLFATPLLDFGNEKFTFFGIPGKIFYIFLLWLLFIAVLALVNRKLRRAFGERGV